MRARNIIEYAAQQNMNADSKDEARNALWARMEGAEDLRRETWQEYLAHEQVVREGGTVERTWAQKARTNGRPTRSEYLVSKRDDRLTARAEFTARRLGLRALEDWDKTAFDATHATESAVRKEIVAHWPWEGRPESNLRHTMSVYVRVLRMGGAMAFAPRVDVGRKSATFYVSERALAQDLPYGKRYIEGIYLIIDVAQVDEDLWWALIAYRPRKKDRQYTLVPSAITEGRVVFGYDTPSKVLLGRDEVLKAVRLEKVKEAIAGSVR